MSDPGHSPDVGRAQAPPSVHSSLLRRLLHKIPQLGYRWILAPLIAGIIGALIINHIVQGFVGPQDYIVYFIGPFSDVPSLQGFAEAFKGADQTTHALNGVKIRFEMLDDHGDPTDAQRIATQIAARPNTLMVIGHILSTQTREALPVYLQKADPPIPVILTTETNPNLLPPQNSQSDPYPVLHLSPTDKQQAEIAASFAISKGAKAFWVVEDVSNPLYADYLAREFIRTIQEKSKNVLLWSTSLSIPPVDALRSLNIDWLFFAGDWHSALIVIRQLKSIVPHQKLGILLTDGCADPDLMNYGGGDLEGVYLTHPLTYKTFSSEGYRIYGANALKLVQRLVEEADRRYGEFSRNAGPGFALRRFLGINRIGDARRALIQQIKDARAAREKFYLSNGESWQFEWTGERMDATFHVWQIQGNKFVDIVYP